MKFHLEGMGLVGAFVAAWLDAHGHEFTWHDTDERRVAWKASTGLAYPSGHKLDLEQLARWVALHDNRLPLTTAAIARPDGLDPTYTAFRNHVLEHTELGQWCYYSNNPPHGGRMKELQKYRSLHISDATTFHLNAQTFVIAMRSKFEQQRTGSVPDLDTARTIVTHGFAPETIGSWSWGWSAQVPLHIAPELREWATQRPCFYMRDGHILDYAYPVPGKSNVWYVGTSLITQREPKSLPLEPKYLAWRHRMERKLDGVAIIGTPLEGTLQEAWRPMPTDGLPVLSKTAAGTLLIRPQYGSAIRHWWLVADALTEELAL